MKRTVFTICSLFNLEKLKRFLNIAEYKVFLIKSFLIREAAIKKNLLLMAGPLRGGGGGKGPGH